MQAVIQEELSLLIKRELKDPRVPSLTITAVELSHDAGQATVFITILGSGGDAPANEIRECLTGLASASGFLRRQLGQVVNTRWIPVLTFKEDKGFANVMRIHELLKKISDTT